MLFDEWKTHTDEGRPLKIHWNIMHMFSSAQIAKLYALEYKLDPEICAMAAVLHDIATVEGKIRENHDILAKDYALGAIARYNNGGRYKHDPISEKESDIIIKAITSHGDKSNYTDDPYVEMIKNVDSIDAYLHGVITKGPRHDRVSEFLENINISE